MIMITITNNNNEATTTTVGWFNKDRFNRM